MKRPAARYAMLVVICDSRIKRRLCMWERKTSRAHSGSTHSFA